MCLTVERLNRVRQERFLSISKHGDAMTTTPLEKQETLEAGTYTVADLAVLLQCSERHVRNQIEGGNIPGLLRFGRIIRFHRQTIHSWLAGRGEVASHA